MSISIEIIINAICYRFGHGHPPLQQKPQPLNCERSHNQKQPLIAKEEAKNYYYYYY